MEHLCAQKRCVHTHMGKACARQQTSNPPQETASRDWASQVDAGSGVWSSLRARDSSGVAHAHLPGLPCHPLAGSQGVSLVSTCTVRSISGRFWTDHLVTPPSSTWQQITTTTALAHHRFNRDQAPSQGLLPRRCLSPPHSPVCRRGGGLQGRRRGPSRALCPGSGLRPRAPWGSMGPPPKPHDTPKDSLQPHPPGWAALLSL